MKSRFHSYTSLALTNHYEIWDKSLGLSFLIDETRIGIFEIKYSATSKLNIKKLLETFGTINFKYSYQHIWNKIILV